ncbi:GDSL esterase lipase, partial [Musa troglodytarum]
KRNKRVGGWLSSTLLGLPLIPPFNNPNTTGSRILQGVNFASAASGILSDTGRLYGNLFSMDDQIANFNITLQQLNTRLGDGAESFLAKSLFFLNTGSNDYVNNYLLPFSDKPKKYTPEVFSDLLIRNYNKQLMNLYDLGGRRFLVASLGPLGCIPNQIGNSGGSSDSCVSQTNHLAAQFNTKLRTMLDELNGSLQGSYFLYWDAYASATEIIDNYADYGFKHQHSACCGGGRSKGQIMCLPLLPLECHNRSQYVFWDPYHPTDAFNAIVAKGAFQGTLQAAHPMNVQQLVET